MPNNQATDLADLNTILQILRKAADKQGLVVGSCVQIVVNANTDFSWTRINKLVGMLGELGWRENAWIGPKNQRGSKIRLQPEHIENLEVLPDVAQAREQQKALARTAQQWYRSNYNATAVRWVIRSKAGGSHVVVQLEEEDKFCSARQDPTRYAFPVAIISHRGYTQWFHQLLTSEGHLGLTTLYQLVQDGRAVRKGQE